MLLPKITVQESKKNIKDYVKTLSIVLNPKDNGGESVELEVDYFQNDEGNVYTNIHFVNTCYGTHSTKNSYYNLSLESFEKAFRRAEEIEFLLEKGVVYE